MNFENINYSDYEIKTPYPKITTTQKDEKVIPELINAYSGAKGEFTASTQYIYQSFIVKTNEDYKGLSRLLEKISIKEMQHLEILSQLLIFQGINPKYCKYIDNNQNICYNWSANSIKYITDVKEFIKYNITLEKGAIKDYTNITNNTENENIIEVISRIILDEESHLEIFNKILEIIEKSENN